ncbi:uncharacterized protein isoform X2 [Rhodnius prolixus]|uniref:uncharacterized protein isoform X2 n=1 Tax=Rhodnius prolixus TaxID=13249 RepID=UPI003D18B877
MADVFTNLDMIRLLEHKSVLFVGDNNIRTLYKDSVCLYQTNKLMDINLIGRNLEESFLGDALICRQNMYKQRAYVERRRFETDKLTLEFLFITHCLSPTFMQYLKEVRAGLVRVPDVICMNSFIWDFTRWGPRAEKRYKKNMTNLVEVLDECLPSSTLFIWITTCPVANDADCIPFVTQLANIHETLCSDILEGNRIAAELFRLHGYDVIDTHHHLFRHTFRRSADGVTFLPSAVRYITYLLLTHIALSWDVTLPGRTNGTALHDEIARSKSTYSTKKSKNYCSAYNKKNGSSKMFNSYINANSSGSSHQSAENTTDEEGSVKTPLIRVKAIWKVLEEFGNPVDKHMIQVCPAANGDDVKNEKKTVEPINSTDSFSEECPAFIGDDVQNEQKSVEPINSTDSFNEVEEGEIITSDLEKPKALESDLNIKNNICQINRENKRVIGELNKSYNGDQSDHLEAALEEGEIVDENLIDRKSVITNWAGWKTDTNLIRDSRKDLVTLEIPSKEQGVLKLNANNYQYWCNNRKNNERSFYRIEGFIKQLKRKLITSKKWKKNLINKNNKKLLFGYEKNERRELFRPKVLHSIGNTEHNGSNVDWVAEQWRQVIQGEPNESVEVLGYWQRTFQNEESEKDATREAYHDFVASKKIERRCSISFL